jgi:hypothetical protein
LYQRASLMMAKTEAEDRAIEPAESTKKRKLKAR